MDFVHEVAIVFCMLVERVSGFQAFSYAFVRPGLHRSGHQVVRKSSVQKAYRWNNENQSALQASVSAPPVFFFFFFFLHCLY